MPPIKIGQSTEFDNLTDLPLEPYESRRLTASETTRNRPEAQFFIELFDEAAIKLGGADFWRARCRCDRECDIRRLAIAPSSAGTAGREAGLEHDPEKRVAVLARDKRDTLRGDAQSKTWNAMAIQPDPIALQANSLTAKCTGLAACIRPRAILDEQRTFHITFARGLPQGFSEVVENSAYAGGKPAN